MDKRKFKKLLVKATYGCSLQHNGFPCNTCFHSLELPLKYDIHEYWLAVLAYRGDYPELEKKPELIEELYQVLRKEHEKESIDGYFNQFNPEEVS